MRAAAIVAVVLLCACNSDAPGPPGVDAASEPPVVGGDNDCPTEDQGDPALACANLGAGCPDYGGYGSTGDECAAAIEEQCGLCSIDEVLPCLRGAVQAGYDCERRVSECVQPTCG